MQEVVAAFKDTSTPKQVQMKGLHIAGQKYFVLKADDGSIYGKQVRSAIDIVRDEISTLMSLHRAERASSLSKQSRLFLSLTTPRLSSQAAPPTPLRS